MNDTINNNTNELLMLENTVNINNYLIILGIGLNVIFYIYYLIRKLIKKCKKNTDVSKCNEQTASLPDVKIITNKPQGCGALNNEQPLSLVKQIVSHNILIYDDINKGEIIINE